jgi:starvation-inducible outer membrane lipoprotein
MKMKTHVLVAAALALAATVGAANALTIENKDKTDVKVMVTPKGGKAMEVDVKAGGKAQADCAKGGELSIGSVKADCTAKTKTIEIKDGKFVAM